MCDLIYNPASQNPSMPKDWKQRSEAQWCLSSAFRTRSGTTSWWVYGSWAELVSNCHDQDLSFLRARYIYFIHFYHITRFKQNISAEAAGDPLPDLKGIIAGGFKDYWLYGTMVNEYEIGSSIWFLSISSSQMPIWFLPGPAFRMWLEPRWPGKAFQEDDISVHGWDVYTTRSNSLIFVCAM